jgi:hypothetical protein
LKVVDLGYPMPARAAFNQPGELLFIQRADVRGIIDHLRHRVSGEDAPLELEYDQLTVAVESEQIKWPALGRELSSDQQ